jgi:hypothetical protein
LKPLVVRPEAEAVCEPAHGAAALRRRVGPRPSRT